MLRNLSSSAFTRGAMYNWRVKAVLNALEQKFGMDNLYNLTGGAQAWADDVDPSIEVA